MLCTDFLFAAKDTNSIACAHAQKRTKRQSAVSGIDALGAGELLPGATHMNTEVSWKCGMMLWQNERSAAAKSIRRRQALSGKGRAWSGTMPSTSRTCFNPGCVESIWPGRNLAARIVSVTIQKHWLEPKPSVRPKRVPARRAG